MDNRIQMIITSLISNGWEQCEQIDAGADWWFENIITFSSVWHPVGVKIYLTLLTDPMEIKMKKIWSVSVSLQMPEQNNLNSIYMLTLNDVKRTDLNAFAKSINDVALKN